MKNRSTPILIVSMEWSMLSMVWAVDLRGGLDPPKRNLLSDHSLFLEHASWNLICRSLWKLVEAGLCQNDHPTAPCSSCVSYTLSMLQRTVGHGESLLLPRGFSSETASVGLFSRRCKASYSRTWVHLKWRFMWSMIAPPKTTLNLSWSKWLGTESPFIDNRKIAVRQRTSTHAFDGVEGS